MYIVYFHIKTDFEMRCHLIMKMLVLNKDIFMFCSNDHM